MRVNKKAKKKDKLQRVKLLIYPLTLKQLTILIDLQQCKVLEPSVKRGPPNDKLDEGIKNKCTLSVEIDKFPCPTQAVERIVKLVTETCSLVTGTNARERACHSHSAMILIAV